MLPARAASPMPSGRVLPSSRASSVPSSSRRARISLPILSSASARAWMPPWTRPGTPHARPAIAASTCAGVGLRVLADHVGQVGRVDVGRVTGCPRPIGRPMRLSCLVVMGCPCKSRRKGVCLLGVPSVLGSARQVASSSPGFRSVSGARTGPASCPTSFAPALTMLTAYPALAVADVEVRHEEVVEQAVLRWRGRRCARPGRTPSRSSG